MRRTLKMFNSAGLQSPLLRAQRQNRQIAGVEQRDNDDSPGHQ